MIRTLVVTLILAAAIPATASDWEALQRISAAADNASAWADSARHHARVALAWRDSTIAWADSAIAWEGVAADKARGRAMECFNSTYYANERAVEAWGRAVRARRRALDGRNEYSDSPMLAWRLQDPGAVIAFEIHNRAREAQDRASAHHECASDAETAAFAALIRAGYIPPTLDGAPGRWAR